MGRSLSNALRLTVAILSLWNISGCGKSTKAGPPLFPAKVNLLPSANSSVNLGDTFAFTATAQTASGTNLTTSFTFVSSDTAILNVAPNGFACAGHWDTGFTTCTPGATGVVQVTALALGQSSVPTFVFVHPAIDLVTVIGILLDNVPVQEPCLSQSQSMALEAHAFSQGSDITSSVGPFTWTAQNPSVVNLAPIVNTAFNFATNQESATAVTPGMTQIYASASGVSSSSFQQPQYQNSGATSPVLDFFETCPIQTINLEVGAAGSQVTSQTTFVAAKGSSQTATAILTDVMGKSSLPNSNNDIVLSKIPLTWTSSQPAVLSAASSCLQSCTITTPLPGAGSVTASCSPPGCNIGYPLVPTTLSTPAAIAACTQFFLKQSGIPSTFSCQQLVPVPVYASPLQLAPGSLASGNGAISGLVTGATSSTGFLATSTGCAHTTPVTCTTSIYSATTATASTGPENPLTSSPNSLMFDPLGARAYMGSDFGAVQINPTNFGTTNSPFTSLGTVTGKVLAVSNNGNAAVFSDTIHTPNQAYVVNAGSSASLSASALNISNAVAAAFSPDQLKTLIFGNGGGSLYVFSPLQALQPPITLSGPANANTVAFSPSGAFAFVAEASANGNPANLTTFATCDNSIAGTVPLPGNPLFMKVLPGLQLEGGDSFGNTIPDGTHVFVLDSTGFDILTSTISPPAPGASCPQILKFVSNDPMRMAQRIELGQGTIQPINFFVSADVSQIYVVAAGHASILVYDFGLGAVTSGIELVGNAAPVGADMSADAGTILVGSSDGMLHQVSTGIGGNDRVQLPFPDLPNFLNPFCTATPTPGPCALSLVVAKP